ncbi:MAG: PAS domain-containing protein [Alphaproteobacteria bacterium]|jgi:hypothetical protein|nr:PAS domain-containing protein [Alphaproteobacteria bacterium]
MAITAPGGSGLLLASRLDFTDLRDARLKAVWDHWNALRGRRPMPAPSEIRPEGLRGALGYVNLIDVLDAPPWFRFRLVGTEIAAAYGRDMTGQPIDAVRPPAYRDGIVDQFRAVVGERQPLLHEIRFQLDWKTHWLVRLSLPLGTADGPVTRLITCSAFDPQMDRFDVRAFYEQLSADDPSGR